MSFADKLTEILGKEWLEVDNPETLELIILNRFGNPIDDISYNFINAVKSLMVGVLPWTVYHVFENIVDALNYNSVIPEIVTAPTCEEIAYAVMIMNSIKKFDFHDDVAKYIAAKAEEEGILWLPEPLEFVNPFLLLDDKDDLRKLQKQVEEKSADLEVSTDTEFSETPLDIQLYKVARIKLSSSLDLPLQSAQND